jgi:hypothetical protein
MNTIEQNREIKREKLKNLGKKMMLAGFISMGVGIIIIIAVVVILII